VLQDAINNTAAVVVPRKAFLVGEAGRHMFHGRHINLGVEKNVTPWPSDHRALVCEFEIDTAKMGRVPMAMVSLTGDRRPGSIVRIVTAHDGQRNDLELALVHPPSSSSSSQQPHILQSIGLRDGTDRPIVELGIPFDQHQHEKLAVVLCERQQEHLVPTHPTAYQVFLGCWSITAEAARGSKRIEHHHHHTDQMERCTWQQVELDRSV